MTQEVRSDAIRLREVQVRTVRTDEEPRWNALMRQHHYLGERPWKEGEGVMAFLQTL